MARKIGFDEAVSLLQEMRSFSEEDSQDTDDLERIVLRHPPSHCEEAAIVLDEVAYNLQAGTRCDGLDISAVNRIGHWLRQLDADQRIKANTSIQDDRNRAA